MDHADPGALHLQQLFYLKRGESRDRDDHVRPFGGFTCLSGEPLAKFASGVFARHHEKVVKGGNSSLVPRARDALVEPVEQIGARSAAFPEQRAARVAREAILKRTEEAMRTVAGLEPDFGMRLSQSL